MEKCCVLIESWQIQCCGEPFKVGDTIEWFVKKWDKVMPDYPDAGVMDYFYEHHPTDYKDWFAFTGTVSNIEICYCLWISDPDKPKNYKMMVRSSCYTEPITEALVWEKKRSKHQFDGYIAHFNDYQIRLSEQSEHFTYIQGKYGGSE